jgi:hypothetical protein
LWIYKGLKPPKKPKIGIRPRRDPNVSCTRWKQSATARRQRSRRRRRRRREEEDGTSVGSGAERDELDIEDEVGIGRDRPYCFAAVTKFRLMR